MTSMNGLVGIARGFGEIYGKNQTNKANTKAAKDAREQGLNLINKMDWEPTYASETVPTYQRTQSPVARSFIESFLMGNNPMATRSTAPNAAITKQVQQTQQNAMFGTPQERLAQQQAYQAQTPWKVQTPTKPIVGAKEEEAMHAAAHPVAEQIGLDKDLYRDLVSIGAIKEGDDAKPYKPELINAVRNAHAAGDDDAARFLMNPKLKREHALLRNRQVRKMNEKAAKLVRKYTSEEE